MPRHSAARVTITIAIANTVRGLMPTRLAVTGSSDVAPKVRPSAVLQKIRFRPKIARTADAKANNGMMPGVIGFRSIDAPSRAPVGMHRLSVENTR